MKLESVLKDVVRDLEMEFLLSPCRNNGHLHAVDYAVWYIRHHVKAAIEPVDEIAQDETDPAETQGDETLLP